LARSPLVGIAGGARAQAFHRHLLRRRYRAIRAPEERGVRGASPAARCEVAAEVPRCVRYGERRACA